MFKDFMPGDDLDRPDAHKKQLRTSDKEDYERVIGADLFYGPAYISG